MFNFSKKRFCEESDPGFLGTLLVATVNSTMKIGFVACFGTLDGRKCRKAFLSVTNSEIFKSLACYDLKLFYQHVGHPLVIDRTFYSRISVPVSRKKLEGPKTLLAKGSQEFPRSLKNLCIKCVGVKFLKNIQVDDY